MAVRFVKKSWWIDFSFDGLRYRKRSPENSRSGALAFEALLKHRLARGEQMDFVAPTVEQKQTFEQFSRKWLEDYARANSKHSEFRLKESILRISLIPYFGMLAVDQITAHHIEQFKSKCLKDGLARKTVNNRLAVLSKCLTMAYEWLKIHGTPPKITWLKCPPPKTNFLSPDECSLLLSKAEGSIYEMVLMALRTGMRQGELKGLQWPSIDLQNQSIVVRHSQNDYSRELESPKSNRVRTIPMDADVYEALYRRKKESGYVFLDKKNRPFESHGLERELREVRYKVGLRPIGWHTLRHTFASHLAMRGVPLHAVQALLGHSSITTTMRYAHVAPSTLRTAIEMLSPKQSLREDFRQPAVNQWIQTMQQETNNP